MSHSTPPTSAHALASELLEGDVPALVLRLPSQVTDESVGPIQDEVRSRLPRSGGGVGGASGVVGGGGGAVLIIDFDKVTLINSIGITCLLQVQDECKRRSARLLLACLPEAISRFLQQLKLDRRFEVAPTVEAALAKAALPR